MSSSPVEIVVRCYPQIFFACHRAHTRDDNNSRVLSAHQANVLDHLDAIEPTHLHQLAAHMGITPSSMSLMIDRLESGGYVRRSRDTHDARRVNLRLTKAGLRIKEQNKDILDRNLVAAMLRRLTPAERATALAGLRSLARAATELVGRGQVKHPQQETHS